MPPVANRRMPARWASDIVAATVVAAVVPLSDGGGQVAPARLQHVLLAGQFVQFRLVQADRRPALPDGDRRRHRPLGAHRRLRGERRLQVQRPGQTVGDQRRFQRHDGPALLDRLGDFRTNDQAERLHPLVFFLGIESSAFAATRQTTGLRGCQEMTSQN